MFGMCYDSSALCGTKHKQKTLVYQQKLRLRDLLKQGNTREWDECLQKTFHDLKPNLGDHINLAHFNSEFLTKSTCNASNSGLGVKLQQENNSGELLQRPHVL